MKLESFRERERGVVVEATMASSVREWYCPSVKKSVMEGEIRNGCLLDTEIENQ